ncbi:hypothetical protein LWI29_002160 [Acer saccharum]|uniref:Uncharacterized protein n=1 Tax=Acer saccharum TaxID=4024 RepID=A0AA39W0N3_ACESA|nr:hypothetical protein LWI29_002160 [Acer saccharum]
MVRIREPIEDQPPGDTKQLHSHHEQSKEEDNKKKENPDDGDKDDVNSRRKMKRRKKMVQEMTNDVRSVQFSSRLMWPPGVLILVRQSIRLSRLIVQKMLHPTYIEFIALPAILLEVVRFYF